MKLILLFSLFLNLFVQANEISDLETIHEIPDASGVCYHSQRDSLFIANDNGNVYEIKTSGEFVRKVYLGDYDLEGVVCDNERLYFAVERAESVILVDPEDLSVIKEMKVKSKFNGEEVLKSGDNEGFEGIAIRDGYFYISNQSYKRYPKRDSSVIIKVKVDTIKDKLKIQDVFDTGYFDISGLTFVKDMLYFLSDDDDLLIVYDVKSKEVVSVISMPELEQEGIAFDTDGFIYLADDNGYVFKGKIK